MHFQLFCLLFSVLRANCTCSSSIWTCSSYTSANWTCSSYIIMSNSAGNSFESNDSTTTTCNSSVADHEGQDFQDVLQSVQQLMRGPRDISLNANELEVSASEADTRPNSPREDQENINYGPIVCMARRPCPLHSHSLDNSTSESSDSG